jgi:SAM-dependent methyltransferase
MYDPVEYWGKRASGYGKKYTYHEEIELLCDIIQQSKPSSILDVGSGSGSVYRYLIDNKVPINSYTMIDFSGPMRKHCFENTGIMPDSWDGKKLPYSDTSFGLVVSLSVALHVPPNHIENFLSELLRVGGRAYLTTYTDGFETLADHVFKHDYYKIFNKLDINIIIDEIFMNGKIARRGFLIEYKKHNKKKGQIK